MKKSIVEKYGHILDDLNKRTKFDYDRMNDSDREIMVDIMTECKEVLDNYYKNQYAAISSWTNLNLEKIKPEGE